MRTSVAGSVWRVVLPYLVVAGLWILLSDRLVMRAITDPSARMHWSTYKGLAFVVVTGGMLYWRSRAEFRAREQALRALKASEEAARRNEALLEAVTEGTPDAIFVKGTDGRYLMVNQGACKMLGKAREQLLGLTDTALFSQADVKRISSDDQDVISQGKPRSYEEEVVIGGEPRTLLTIKGPVRDGEGKVFGVFGVCRDITERKQAEQALVRTEAQLRALTTKLQGLREEERTRISREIHDELGQMLTALKMDIRWVEHRFEALSPEPRINAILDRLVSMSELADSTIKAMQRLAAELRPGVLDKLGLATALQYEAARFQERSGIECQLTVPAAEPQLPLEIATAYFRIFQEALTNVARHSEATHVEARLHCHESQCYLEIRDNGKGISQAALDDPASLGLLGIKERARLLGGQVRWENLASGGTAVVLKAPGCCGPKSKESVCAC